MAYVEPELLINTHKIGQEITGKLFHPQAFETLGTIDLQTGAVFIAIKLFPTAADTDFKEPFVVMLRDENVENFVKAIRIAQAGVPLNCRNGGES